MAYLVKVGTRPPIPFVLRDPVTGSAVPFATVGKALTTNGADVTAGGAITEIEGGRYSYLPAVGELNASGLWHYHFTDGASSAYAEVEVQVVAFDPADGAALGLTAVPATLAAGGITAATFAADAISASALAGAAATVIATAVVSALTAAGVLDVEALAGQQVIESIEGEDRDYTIVLDTAPTGSPTFTFTIAETLEEALADPATVETGDVSVVGATITVDSLDIGTADLEAGSYAFACRRTDEGNRRVVGWGRWTIFDR